MLLLVMGRVLLRLVSHHPHSTSNLRRSLVFRTRGDWPALAEAHRREFLARTDRGVFSQAGRGGSQRLARLPARLRPGRVVAIDAG